MQISQDRDDLADDSMPGQPHKCGYYKPRLGRLWRAGVYCLPWRVAQRIGRF